MLQKLRHRCPPGASLRVDSAAGVAIGWLKDLPYELGPGHADGQQILVAIDGAIVNGGDLLKRVRGAPRGNELDESFRAVRAVYESKGWEGLRDLEGPFSISIWDEGRKQLILARDAMGEKSLYYYVDPDRRAIIFGSDIRAIAAHGEARLELDVDSLAVFFMFGWLPGRLTMFKNLFKLLPGECLTYEIDGRLTRRRYWRLPQVATEIIDEADSVRRSRELFLEGLARYVSGRSEAGVFLSGGIDSSILVAGLREIGVPRIHTFAIGIDARLAKARKAADLDFARLVATAFGTRHEELVIEPGHDLSESLPEALRQFDDLLMTPNMYTKFLLGARVRESGLTYALTGLGSGSDAAFMGAEKLRKTFADAAELETDAERYLAARGSIFSLDEAKKVLRGDVRITKDDILGVISECIEDLEDDADVEGYVRRAGFTLSLMSQPERSLKGWELACSGNGVEVRSPFLYRPLVELAAQLPASFDDQPIVSLKAQLMKAFESDLPEAVLRRPVTGYPTYYWTNGELAQLQRLLLNEEALDKHAVLSRQGVLEILEGESRSAKPSGRRSWALTQFALWCEVQVRDSRLF